MQIETVAVERLIPYARNSRTHSEAQVAQIAASIREFGFTNPVLIDAEGGIIAGHGRVMGARKLQMAEVPCIRLGHLTEAQRRAYVIADNKLAANAGWDEEMLALELRDLMAEGYDVGLTGFELKEIDALLADLDATKDGKTDPDAAPPVQAEAVTRPGDVWVMGRHRIMCGDSTDAGTMGRLMAGKQADVCWTDPPYNVAYGGDDGCAAFQNKGRAGSRITREILNDDLSDADFHKFLGGFYRAAHSVMKKGAAIYVAHAETERSNFTSQFLAAGFKLSGVIIWRKDQLVLGRSDYQWIHEPILYGWKEGGAHQFHGGRKQTTVSDLGSSGSPFIRRADGKWQITIGEETLIVEGGASVEWVEDSVMRELKPKRNDVHPTMKPVALIARMLKNSAKPGAIVLDSFSGSGSTLVAAEQLGMAARLMELSPQYVDVAVRRWQQFTGKRATLEATGAEFPG